jgi:site-specific DNA-methyltransferase (adenine-specific)
MKHIDVLDILTDPIKKLIQPAPWVAIPPFPAVTPSLALLPKGGRSAQQVEYERRPARIPTLQRHKRCQSDLETPPDFFGALDLRFGEMKFDLAATADNAKCLAYYSPTFDGLKRDWSALPGNLWLHPPAGNVGPWAAKCAASAPFGQTERRIFLLVPAAVGASWFQNYVHGKAQVLALAPRLKFVGRTRPSHIDSLLCIYGEEPGFGTWRWRPSETPLRSVGTRLG